MQKYLGMISIFIPRKLRFLSIRTLGNLESTEPQIFANIYILFSPKNVVRLLQVLCPHSQFQEKIKVIKTEILDATVLIFLTFCSCHHYIGPFKGNCSSLSHSNSVRALLPSLLTDF